MHPQQEERAFHDEAQHLAYADQTFELEVHPAL